MVLLDNTQMCKLDIARLGELIGCELGENMIVSVYIIFQAIFKCIFRGFSIYKSRDNRRNNI